MFKSMTSLNDSNFFLLRRSLITLDIEPPEGFRSGQRKGSSEEEEDDAAQHAVLNNGACAAAVSTLDDVISLGGLLHRFCGC